MVKASYTMVVEWDPDENVFVASIPALSVVDSGESREEAIARVREAAEVTVEGLRATGQHVPLGKIL